MAENEIHIKVKVDDKGNLSMVGQKADKAAKGMDDLGKSSRTADRNLKGAARTSSSTTKNFSKMSQGMGGLVGAYATLAANVFAISAAFQFLKEAGDVAALQRSQEEYALTTGRSMSLLTERLQDASGGILSFADAAQAGAIGAAAGLTNQQLTGLATVAKNASVALGRDLTDSFNRLTRGAIKAEPELLDELGIIIRLDKVSEDYARTLGKTAKELTTFEKSQAVVNAVLEQGNEKFAEVGDNVNQIARLGKAFNDLVKEIKEGIEPIASFLGRALADNIKGLAAAFAILGVSIAKALIPAGPQMESMSDLAQSAKDRMSAAGMKDTKAGRSIVDGDFGKHEITQIEKSMKVTQSKVIDYSKVTKAQVKKDLLIMQADHARMTAANSTGVRKYTAQASAYFRMMQAEHGMVMGTMKGAWGGFATAASKALNAIAILGMLYTAIVLIKEMMEYFKDPAILKMVDAAGAVEDKFKDTNEAIQKMNSQGLKETNNVLDGILQRAEFLANFDFGGLASQISNIQFGVLENSIGETLEEYLARVERIGYDPDPSKFGSSNRGGQSSLDSEQQDLNNAIIQQIREGSILMDELNTKARDWQFGSEASRKAFDDINTEVKTQLDIIENSTQSSEAYNAAVKVLQGILGDAEKQAIALSSALAPADGAIKATNQLAESHAKYIDGLKQTESRYDVIIGNVKQLESILETVAPMAAGMTLGELVKESTKGVALLESITSLTGISDDEAKALTFAELREKTLKATNKLRQQEFAIERKTNILKRQQIKAERGATPLQAARVKRDFEILNIQAEINKLVEDDNFHHAQGVAIGDTRRLQLADQKAILEEQLLTAKELNNEFSQLGNAFKGGFEKSATSNIAALIKGEESSIKDAMLKIAQGAVSSVADKLAEQYAVKISDFLFGPDPLEAAVKDNTAAVKANTESRTTGQGTTPGVTSGGASGGASGSQQGGFLANIGNTISGGFTKASNYLLGEKTTGVQLAQTGGGMAGLGTANVENTFRKGGVFTDFVNSLKDLFSGDAPFLEGIGNVFKDGISGFGTLFKDFGGMFGDLLGGMGGAGGLLSIFGFAGGGIHDRGKKYTYSTGGIANGPQSGYPAMLHGREAIVPLPDGKSIPVNLSGAGQINNISITIASDGRQQVSSGAGTDRENEDLGRAIALAVQEELQNQKRSGGILSPYGVA
tara:strand:+ start:5314 stop:8886 length:3573 start_codon:yes stop_codon:yes gene_type:complete